MRERDGAIYKSPFPEGDESQGSAILLQGAAIPYRLCGADKSVTLTISLAPADGWGNAEGLLHNSHIFGPSSLLEEELDLLEPPNAFGISGGMGLRSSSSWQDLVSAAHYPGGANSGVFELELDADY